MLNGLHPLWSCAVKPNKDHRICSDGSSTINLNDISSFMLDSIVIAQCHTHNKKLHLNSVLVKFYFEDVMISLERRLMRLLNGANDFVLKNLELILKQL